MRNLLLLLITILSTNLLVAQPEKVKGDLPKTSSQDGYLAVNASPEEAWKAIKENYGHVGIHHKGIQYAYTMNTEVSFYLGAIRHSQIKKNEYMVESITVYDEANKTFTTIIDEASENTLPLLQQQVSIQEKNGQTYVCHEVLYENATRQEIGKIKKWNRNYLKAYKEVIEEMMPKGAKLKHLQQRLSSMLYE